MYTLDEMKERLEYLRRISPAGGKHLVDDLLTAITAYLSRDADFELQVNKTLDKVIADAFHHGLKYEHDELLDPWRKIIPVEDAPEGYDDVGKLFKGNEVFEEIMAVSDAEFRAAFYVEETGDGNNSATLKYGNRLIEDWIARLKAAVEAELEGLKAIMSFCANRSYGVEWAIVFEELGVCVERHSVRYYAKNIFYTRSWGWLIETFNLRVYRPSYMEELPDWNEESSDF